jgi:nucleoside-diphosphate-sugar epimerase
MDVFVAGGTGYLGRAMIGALLNRRHAVRALTRPTSLDRVPAAATPVVGDALDSATFADALFPATTLVHLVGTPHPGPSKAAEFERVDLASIRSSVDAARCAQIAHLVYVSVAQPAPVMRAYVAARAKGEASIVEARLTATMLRPWYVLGPGHRWPIALKPIYWVAEQLPATREAARRMGLVTLAQMVAALVQAVEHPPATGTVRIVDVPGIRAARLSQRTPRCDLS